MTGKYSKSIDIASSHSSELMCKSYRIETSGAKILKVLGYNKMEVSEQPYRLKLYPLEERLVAPRIPLCKSEIFHVVVKIGLRKYCYLSVPFQGT